MIRTAAGAYTYGLGKDSFTFAWKGFAARGHAEGERWTDYRGAGQGACHRRVRCERVGQRQEDPAPRQPEAMGTVLCTEISHWMAFPPHAFRHPLACRGVSSIGTENWNRIVIRRVFPGFWS